MISIVVTTLNESEKLMRCLDSVRNLADEIVVVDLESNDDLEKIISQYKKITVFKHTRVKYVELVREYGISKAKGEWILVLDPDEVLPKTLVERLKEIVREDKVVAVNIPRKNIFFDKWISHSNFWPDRQIRFFKKGRVIWPKRIHFYPKIEGRVLSLEAKEELAFEHYGYDNFSQFIERQKRYSDIEAQNRIEEGRRFNLKDLLWYPTREFLVRFIKHLGFLDGVDGVFIVGALMYYQVMVEFKMLKLQKRK